MLCTVLRSFVIYYCFYCCCFFNWCHILSLYLYLFIVLTLLLLSGYFMHSPIFFKSVCVCVCAILPHPEHRRNMVALTLGTERGHASATLTQGPWHRWCWCQNASAKPSLRRLQMVTTGNSPRWRCAGIRGTEGGLGTARAVWGPAASSASRPNPMPGR